MAKYQFCDADRNNNSAETLMQIARGWGDTVVDIIEDDVGPERQGWIAKKDGVWVSGDSWQGGLDKNDKRLLKSFKQALYRARKERENATNS